MSKLLDEVLTYPSYVLKIITPITYISLKALKKAAHYVMGETKRQQIYLTFTYLIKVFAK